MACLCLNHSLLRELVPAATLLRRDVLLVVLLASWHLVLAELGDEAAI